MRRRTTLLLGGAVAVALGLGSLVGGVLAESRSAVSASPAASGALVEHALTGTAGGVGAAGVSRLEAQVHARPRDPELLVQLGFAYQLRWRETADASYLPRSEVALRRALRFGNDDANAVLGLGSLALIQHEFRAALIVRASCREAAARLVPPVRRHR